LAVYLTASLFHGVSNQSLAEESLDRISNPSYFSAVEKKRDTEETLTDVSDWDGGRLPVAFGLLVVG
jgi:hypothetical protein